MPGDLQLPYKTLPMEALFYSAVLSSFRGMFNPLRELSSTVIYHLYTLYLFTKSDIKTTVIPISLFSMATAPQVGWTRVIPTAFWLWVQLLMFNLFNQTMEPEEDELIKKFRPLPAKRITLEQACILRWVMLPVCYLHSIFYSREVLGASVLLTIWTLLYNQGGCAKHWVGRNILNGLGFLSFKVGGALVANQNHSELDFVGVLSIMCGFYVFLTTVHAQDFQDVEGDKLVGRRTLPMVFPRSGRPATLALLSSWSLWLSLLWQLSAKSMVAFNLLGLVVGLRFVLFRTERDDHHTYIIYNVWVATALSLPAYYRYIA